jgi:hypothetical protein
VTSGTSRVRAHRSDRDQGSEELPGEFVKLNNTGRSILVHLGYLMTSGILPSPLAFLQGWREAFHKTFDLWR